MKSRETEGPFELYVTRTPGYLWALLFRRLKVHPIVVTLLSIIIGSLAGLFFYFDSLQLNLIGMGLLVWANWYDCADGQLARMTGQKTMIGRVLDGFAGDTWFLSIYIALALRMTPTCGLWAWLLVCWAGFFCHTRQCQLADRYRQFHLYLIGASNELQNSKTITDQYKSLSWRGRDWFEKLYLYFYARYTKAQEKMTPQLQKLLKSHSKEDMPILQKYRKQSQALMPHCQVLTFDARVGVLFLSLLLGIVWLYPLLEITLFEALRYWVNHRHESLMAAINKEIALK